MPTKPNRSLVIVESPTKAKTIRRFLGDEFEIMASMGHVRDLPSNADEIPTDLKKEKWARLGVNVKKGYEPLYVIPDKKKKTVAELRRALKGVNRLYIATDEDREGESIGWHLLQVLEPKVPVERMVFHEITAEAILKALKDTRKIDEHLVDAQETRRILDRLVGYTLSPCCGARWLRSFLQDGYRAWPCGCSSCVNANVWPSRQQRMPISLRG